MLYYTLKQLLFTALSVETVEFVVLNVGNPCYNAAKRVAHFQGGIIPDLLYILIYKIHQYKNRNGFVK